MSLSGVVSYKTQLNNNHSHYYLSTTFVIYFKFILCKLFDSDKAVDVWLAILFEVYVSLGW